MTRKERNRIAGTLGQARALIEMVIASLESYRRMTDEHARDLQRDLEDAERIVAIAGQDLA